MKAEMATLFGAIVGTLLSAATVAFAFLRPTIRFLEARIRREQPSFSDRLCAGIWLSAMGAIVVSLVSLFGLATGYYQIWIAAVAWVGIGIGYFLHFTAWRASFVGHEGRFTPLWGTALAALAIGAASFVGFYLD